MSTQLHIIPTVRRYIQAQTVPTDALLSVNLLKSSGNFTYDQV
jgi:hypothetical protein